MMSWTSWAIEVVLERTEDPAIWWPYFRDVINIIWMNFTESNSDWVSRFFRALWENIPCWSCKENYKTYIEKNQPDFYEKERCLEWILWLHNEVNKENWKDVWDMDMYKYYLKHKYENPPV